jgi:hypothetical protein
VDELEVEVPEVDPTVTIVGSTITANLSGATYQWIHCDTGEEIEGATSQSFTPEQIGEYAVIITIDGCQVTSPCAKLLNTSNSIPGSSTLDITIYPNPTKRVFNMRSEKNIENAVVEIVDMKGASHILSTTEIDSSVDYSYDLSNYSPGMYVVKIYNDEVMVLKNLVVK